MSHLDELSTCGWGGGKINGMAILVMHYAGVSCDMKAIKKISTKYKIPIIEDAAQCIESRYKNKYLGTIGDLGCISFHETKNLHSGVGGLLVVNNKKFVKKTHFIFDKGTDRYLVQQRKQKYYSWVTIGSSFLMSEFVASYLFPQILWQLTVCPKQYNIIY